MSLRKGIRELPGRNWKRVHLRALAPLGWPGGSGKNTTTTADHLLNMGGNETIVIEDGGKTWHTLFLLFCFAGK